MGVFFKGLFGRRQRRYRVYTTDSNDIAIIRQAGERQPFLSGPPRSKAQLGPQDSQHGRKKNDRTTGPLTPAQQTEGHH